MQTADLKYLLAYLGPLSAYVAVWYGGNWSWAAVILTFGIIPLLELIIPPRGKNPDGPLTSKRSDIRFFDFLLYLHVPMLYGLIWFFLWRLTQTEISGFEATGMILGVGIYVGASGINVGHELGHRSSWAERFLAKVLLLPALYLHFYIEHNRGHHRNVCTPQDPATARFGEGLYQFLWRSTTQSYAHAWQLERERLVRTGKAFISFSNQMIQFTILQILYLIIVYVAFGLSGILLAISIAFIGFVLLECTNYIEHYGLVRKQLETGKYERVTMKHSWNSNHDVGRIFLYELTRHADHHYKASKKYQVLDHIEESPQLPLGYPASILVALIPPLWFSVMNDRIPVEMRPV